MQEPEHRKFVPGDFSGADVSHAGTQEVHGDVDESSKDGLDSAGYLRGWRLHLVSLRFVRLFDFLSLPYC